MTIRRRILFGMALAALLTMGAVIITASYKMDTVFVDNFKGNSSAQLDRMSSFTKTFFSNALSVANFLSTESEVVDNLSQLTNYKIVKEAPKLEDYSFGEKQVFDTLTAVRKMSSAYQMIFAANADGAVTISPYTPLPHGFDTTTRGWFASTMRAGKGIVTEAYMSTTGEMVCTVTSLIRDENGRAAGVVGIDIGLQGITEQIAAATVGKTGYMLLLDHQGQVVGDPKNSGSHVSQSERWLGKKVTDLPNSVRGPMQSLVNMKNGFQALELNGVEMFGSVRTTDNGWTIIMLQEKAELYAGAMGVTIAIAQVGVLVFLLVFGMAWVIARTIATPIATLVQASQAVSQGDLQAIPRDGKAFKGEVGVLHASLLQMVEKLTELIATAQSKVDEAEQALMTSRDALERAEEAKKEGELARRQGILQTAQSIGDILGELTVSAKHLAGEAEETGRLSAEQQMRMGGTAHAIHEMNTVVAEVAHSTSRTAVLADDARHEVRKGRELVHNLVNSMQEIENKAVALQKGLGSLRDHADDIGKIMNIINDIADQTNLLALNAAIEAARAGEAGRGFAVVADEVRKLAEKTMEATKQVDTTIKTIQQSTKENTEAIEITVTFVTNSTSVAGDAGAALQSIEAMVENTASEIRSIATASEEQSATLEEITNSANAVTDISQNVAQSAASSHEAVEELTGVTEKLNGIVRDLQKENG